MRVVAFASVLLAASLPGLSGASGDNPKKNNNPRNNNPNNHKPRDLSKGDTMFVVPYAHLDTQWRWAYPQVIREFIANTLHHNFDLIEKYPNYTFNFSGSRRYEMMKEYYPAEYERLKGYIKAGRWFPCGSSVDENDANVPSGESLIRHVLYGNHFFRREFGVASEEYMLPDCFGFPYALPSILNYCGIKGFSTQKLTWNSANGIPFKVGTWEGPDGKSIVAALDPGGYGSRVEEDLSQNTSWLARIEKTGKISGAYVDYKYYGTGDTGGGPTAASVDWVEKSIKGDGPITVVSSHADEMVKSLTPEQIKNLPHYKGELLLVEHSAGSVSSEAMMKRWNRKNELLAQGAEEASVAAMWLGRAAYPSQRIYNAWDLVLGSQMHDMLPGTSIPKAYEFCWNDELLAQNQFGAVETDAVGAVASAMDTRSQGVAIVVYNPLSIPRTDVVEATVPLNAELIQVLTAEGTVIPAQVVERSGAGSRILFTATVPACGFACFHAMRSEVRRVNADQWALGLNGGWMIMNAKLRVAINYAGDIASVYDKVNRREVLKAPVRLDFQYENPRQFPAWNMDWADQQKPPYDQVHGPAKITVIEDGPVRSTIEVERETNGSKFVQDISLTAGGDEVVVRNKIDWQTKETALKASIPLANGNPKATYDIALGAIERGNNELRKYEVPQHQWFNVDKPDSSCGVGILNESKYGSDKPDDNTVRLTMIYTPGVRGGYNDQATQDFGHHDIVFAIAPHAGDWRKAGVPWQAKRLNQPLRAFLVPSHPGPLGKSFSLFSTSSKQVEIQAIKKAEDSEEVIVRLRELHGATAHGVHISAFGGIAYAREVDGQERVIDKVRMQKGEIVTDVPAFSLKSFTIRLRESKLKWAMPDSKLVAINYDSDVVSKDGNPGDGSFDGKGHAIAAEQLDPYEGESSGSRSSPHIDGILFRFGPTTDGAKNALSARGQTIALPVGSHRQGADATFSRVYLLAASSNGDRTAQFKIGKKPVWATIQSWNGYVGQWDNRLWAGNLGVNFTNYGAMVGLEPGYVKPGEVAWFASHSHTPDGNTFYEYTYLYKIGFDIPAGAKTLTLPNDPAIKIMAITVARGTHDQAKPASPLSDDLKDHVATDRPSISPASGTFTDSTVFTISPPLYHRGGGLHYTTDGSTPTVSSPVSDGTVTISDPTTLKVVEVDGAGHAGPVASAFLNVKDTTPPKVVSATTIKAMGLVRIQFSEPLDKKSAENPDNFQFGADTSIVSLKLSPDGKTVNFVLSTPSQSGQVWIKGVRDLSQSGNPMQSTTAMFTDRGAVLSQATFEPKTTKTLNGAALPVKKSDTWTINFFCKIDAQPEDRTLIAGFGNFRDGRTGTGRYFAKFPGGINFWVCDRDLRTNVPLDTGKWQMLTATYDGATLRLYKNGEKIGEKTVALEDDSSVARVMPLDAWERQRRFGGEVRDFTIWDQDLPAGAIQKLYEGGKG
ncbi:MAG: glycoside hydrolase family 38 C-terminal domain-containing protein [Fimbriimonadales bacterium]